MNLEGAKYVQVRANSVWVRKADVPIDLVNAFVYNMPAYSVSTLVLRQAAAGDFNLDGAVDADDLSRWTEGFGISGFGIKGALKTQGDSDYDRDVDGQDLLNWQRELGVTEAAIASLATPEPTAGLLLTLGGAVIALAKRSVQGNP